MQCRFKMVLAYDGTEFHGWQGQPGWRTVQGVLREALTRLLREPVEVQGASRTDAKVHARGQVASFSASRNLAPESLRDGLSALLPADVALLSLSPAPADFHPARDAASKLYRYTIFNSPQRPVAQLEGRYVWHVWHPLDLDAMRVAAGFLVGQHDFAAFASRGSSREGTVRTIHRVSVQRAYEKVRIDVEGDGFLYNQVRIIVGTLVEVGRGHWPPQRVAQILASRDRTLAGPTAPAQGLCLQWVRYKPVEVGAHGA